MFIRTKLVFVLLLSTKSYLLICQLQKTLIQKTGNALKYYRIITNKYINSFMSTARIVRRYVTKKVTNICRCNT